MKNISRHAQKTRSWYLLRVLFKISDEHSRHLLWETSRTFYPRQVARISGQTIQRSVIEPLFNQTLRSPTFDWLSREFKSGFNRFPRYVWSWETAATRARRLETQDWYNFVVLYSTSTCLLNFLQQSDLCLYWSVQACGWGEGGGKRGGGWEENCHKKRTGVLVAPFRGSKSGFVTPYRVFSLKRSTAEAFAVPLRVLNRKNKTGDDVLF